MDKPAPHPRFRGRPPRSALQLTEQEIRQSYWRYSNAHIFPQKALRADVSVQRYAVFPRPYYVDMLKTCVECSRAFIFYAREQHYWYETLGFYIDVDCVRCVECRRKQRAAKRHMERYAELQARDSLSRKEMMHFVDDCIFLFQQGQLKNLSHLGSIKNAALQQIPDYAGTKTLQLLLQSARTIGEIS
ncbi:Probable zinc-ribbon domain-containing protein [Duganella sp. CF458]|uniref:zinc-ribbon domain containing protein n=1 Tax=Duganella sp. CF458 TaxID=1884368 RepID=UPI0008F42571|nr:zinc-ribbon domain containing protein [Duganella sp. CF458]SFG99885.1 Probable zinc-ribbon domain-containing protein [Duganella sp. CF458]